MVSLELELVPTFHWLELRDAVCTLKLVLLPFHSLSFLAKFLPITSVLLL